MGALCCSARTATAAGTSVHLYICGTTKLHCEEEAEPTWDLGLAGRAVTNGGRQVEYMAMYPATLCRPGSTRGDPHGSDLMLLLSISFSTTMTSRRRALRWGRRNRRNLWRAWARYRMLVRVTVVQPDHQHIPGQRPIPRQLQASRRLGMGPRAEPSAQWAVHPCADGSFRSPRWGRMTRVPGWLGSNLNLFGGRACSNCVSPTQARGLGTRSHAGCLLQTAEPPKPTKAHQSPPEPTRAVH